MLFSFSVVERLTVLEADAKRAKLGMWNTSAMQVRLKSSQLNP